MLIREILWQLKLLTKNNIITISLALTLAYLLIFLLIKPLGHTESVLVVFVLNDPATIGLFFVGVSLLSERRSNITLAINILPVNLATILIAKSIALSLLGLVCGLLMTFAAVGCDFNMGLFCLATFGLSMIACFIGIIITAFYDKFMKFILATVPIILIIVNGTMLDLFNIMNNLVLKLLPFNGAVQILSKSVGSQLYDEHPIRYHILHLTVWLMISGWLAIMIYKRKIQSA